MRDTVRFLQSGRIVEIDDCEPTDTVLDWLRARPDRRGTKEGCAEGDCGACTVVLGELAGDTLRYRAVNACIQPLATLDGRQLVTVEDLAESDGRLHPVQQALVDCHGSQCGFCTPGFVMSLFALFQESPDAAPDRAAIDRALAGNLCRCTGYAPIVRAARQALPAGRSDRFLAERPATLEQLRAMRSDEPLTVRGLTGRFAAPRSRAELAELLAGEPSAVLVAGATDVGLWITKQLRDFRLLVYTGQVRELLEVGFDESQEALSIGAAVTYRDAAPALLELYPGFAAVLERLGGLQVRNLGTVGGNIANGSPIGDTPPGLIAIGARLELASAEGSRFIDLEDFFLDYGRQDLRQGEFVARILLPKPPAGRLFRTWKVSRRFEQDISTVCAGFAVDLEGGKVARARLCYGGMAGIPRRARACEKALLGQTWNEASVRSAITALAGDFEPLTDLRGSAEYRHAVAGNLLLRLFFDTAPPAGPVMLEAARG